MPASASPAHRRGTQLGIVMGISWECGKGAGLLVGPSGPRRLGLTSPAHVPHSTQQLMTGEGVFPPHWICYPVGRSAGAWPNSASSTPRRVRLQVAPDACAILDRLRGSQRRTGGGGQDGRLAGLCAVGEPGLPPSTPNPGRGPPPGGQAAAAGAPCVRKSPDLARGGPTTGSATSRPLS